MSFVDESARWDAVETAARIRRREVSIREVIDAAIERAERAAPLGAIVARTFEAARFARPSGPWAGVPTFIKDLAQVEGVTTSWGSRAAGRYVSRRTDPSLRRLFATGLVSLGKSATPEFGLTATTEPLGRPPCRNPWDPSRSTGGSSGGAGSIVASGVVPVAHASDGGGSIRIPASCNGLVGLKPTRRRFDMDGSHLLPVNVAVQGIVSRTVRDTVAFFAALERETSPLPPIGPVRPEPRAPLRIGLFVEPPLGTPVHPEVKRAAEDAARLCESLGHHVEAIQCPFTKQLIEDFLLFWGSLGYLYVRAGKLLTHRGFEADQLEPWTHHVGAYFRRDVASSLRAIARLRSADRIYAQVMERYDVLISPTLGEPPPPLGHLSPDLPFDVKFERLVRFAAFTPIQNATGAPGLSLPLGRTQDGVPIGVHFAARVREERTLLELAYQLEAAQPWERMSTRWHELAAA
jgi:amidase